MLKLILACTLVLAVAWSLRRLCRALSSGVSILIAALSGMPRRSRASGAVQWQRDHAVLAEIASAEPPSDDFYRLTCEALVYAARPHVTVMHQVACWPEDPVLIRTTADPYGRRTYVETLRLIAGQMVHVVCLTLDGADAPAEVGRVQFPAEQIQVGVLRCRIEDIASAGAFLRYHDRAGRICETRLPRQVKHHA